MVRIGFLRDVNRQAALHQMVLPLRKQMASGPGNIKIIEIFPPSVQSKYLSPPRLLPIRPNLSTSDLVRPSRIARQETSTRHRERKTDGYAPRRVYGRSLDGLERGEGGYPRRHGQGDLGPGRTTQEGVCEKVPLDRSLCEF